MIENETNLGIGSGGGMMPLIPGLVLNARDARIRGHVAAPNAVRNVVVNCALLSAMFVFKSTHS